MTKHKSKKNQITNIRYLLILMGLIISLVASLRYVPIILAIAGFILIIIGILLEPTESNSIFQYGP